IFGENAIVPWTLPMWSLSVEEHYYLVFPFLIYLAFRNGISILNFGVFVLLPLCLLALLWRYHIYQTFEESAKWTYYSSDARYDSLLFGAAAACFFIGRNF